MGTIEAKRQSSGISADTSTGRTDVIVAKFAWNFSGKLRIIPVNWGKLCYNFGIMEDLQFGKFCQNGRIPTEFLIQMLRNFSEILVKFLVILCKRNANCGEFSQIFSNFI